MREILRDAYAVLLPAIADLRLTDDLNLYFQGGGRSLLLGESRGEYVARRMSSTRMNEETGEHFRSLVAEIAGLAGPPLIAADHEPAGIQRLHHLVPKLPGLDDLLTMNEAEIEICSKSVALGALSLGVNMFLSPIVDVVTGRNVWLDGRTLGKNPERVARIACAFIRGAESAGVATTPKHFPGHHDITLDPAIEMGVVPGGKRELETGLAVFKDVLAVQPSACMIGPALVPAVDPDEPSSTSATTVRLLRDAFDFKGMIVSDDLDGKAILAGRTIEQTAVASMRSGADLLLVAAGPQIHSIAKTLESTAQADDHFMKRLAASASVVRRVADRKRQTA